MDKATYTKEYMIYDSTYITLEKTNLIYGDRKQTSGFLGLRRLTGVGHKRTFLGNKNVPYVYAVIDIRSKLMGMYV